MTEAQAISIIKLSLPAGLAETDKVASALLSYALNKISRKKGVDYNREYKTANLTSGQRDYVLGADLWSGQGNVWNVQEMNCTDAKGHPIWVIGKDDWNDIARGSTTTGRPTHATVHSANRVLQLFPIPNSNYPIEAYVTKKITAITDLLEIYHDIPIDIAGLAIKAGVDPNVQMALVKEGLADILADSGTSWTGSKIMIQRPLGDSDIRMGSDSGNLTGE
jgi:hypothetical protein